MEYILKIKNAQPQYMTDILLKISRGNIRQQQQPNTTQQRTNLRGNNQNRTNP